jgi:hypothetical protein
MVYKPSLDDARARIKRANEHITTLQSEIARHFPSPRKITAGVAGGIIGGRELIHSPPIISIFVGETIYNLRAALDYLVYELYYLDAGKPFKRTQFPIADKIAEWNKNFPQSKMTSKEKKKLWLHKLTGPHQATLKALQPCSKCKWTGTLRDLSNPDKHRQLLKIESSIDQGPSAMIGPLPAMITIDLITRIAFEDGMLVVDTLNSLEKEVSNVIKHFQSDF